MSATAPETGAAPPLHPPQILTQLASGHIVASALQVVVRLGIPDRLAQGPRSAADLAAEAGVLEDPLFRVMRALASVGVFAEPAPRQFALTAVGELLRRDAPRSMRDMALWISSPFHFRVYAELMHSVETGQPAVDKVTGMPVFEYFARDTELAAIFNNAMTAFSRAVVPAVLDAYDFSGIGTLVDVAGGHGAVLTAILQRYAHMRGVLFDVEHVIRGAAERVKASGVGDRCQLVHGDFFKEVPAGGDAYIMKHIIHDWDDDRARVILQNIHRAMGDRRGRLILLESVIAPGTAPDFGKIIDLEMLAMPGGHERSEQEFAALFESAGFRLSRVVRTESPLSVVEAFAVQ